MAGVRGRFRLGRVVTCRVVTRRRRATTLKPFALKDHPFGRLEVVVVCFGSDEAEHSLLDFAVGACHIAKRKGAEARPQGHQPDQHAEVADAVDDKRFVRSRRSRVSFDVKTDEEVRADADQFPEHKHHRNVASDHDAQHAKAEERQVLKETIVTPRTLEIFTIGKRHFGVGKFVQLVVHVAECIKMHAGSNQRDHAEHAEGECIDIVADRQPQFTEDAQFVPVGSIVLGSRVVCMSAAMIARGVAMFFRCVAVGMPVGSMIIVPMRSNEPNRNTKCRVTVGRFVCFAIVCIAMVGWVLQRVIRQPHTEQRGKTADGRKNDRRGGEQACPFSVRAHALAEKQDQHKRHQWCQPCHREQFW